MAEKQQPIGIQSVLTQRLVQVLFVILRNVWGAKCLWKQTHGKQTHVHLQMIRWLEDLLNNAGFTSWILIFIFSLDTSFKYSILEELVTDAVSSSYILMSTVFTFGVYDERNKDKELKADMETWADSEWQNIKCHNGELFVMVILNSGKVAMRKTHNDKATRVVMQWMLYSAPSPIPLHKTHAWLQA